MVEVHRGDVVICDLNPVIGSEQSGRRPAIVMQVEAANLRSPHTIVVPFTTKIRQRILASHVLVRAGTAGLIEDSVALCEQVRVIDMRRVVRVLGRLDDDQLREVESAMRVILGL
ncbi:MAG: type II toxin-antitoxin system PemK/MazF family toxin [Candidatus Hydrogenedentes bacterium]|nr:type II toxin-antitoxin system PemK/MazF family toxin [Candidatus Hydrogenedentota bacterium]